MLTAILDHVSSKQVISVLHISICKMGLTPTTLDINSCFRIPACLRNWLWEASIIGPQEMGRSLGCWLEAVGWKPFCLIGCLENTSWPKTIRGLFYSRLHCRLNKDLGNKLCRQYFHWVPKSEHFIWIPVFMHCHTLEIIFISSLEKVVTISLVISGNLF